MARPGPGVGGEGGERWATEHALEPGGGGGALEEARMRRTPPRPGSLGEG